MGGLARPPNSDTPRVHGVFGNIAAAVLRFRGLGMAIIAAVLVVAGFGIAQINVDFSSQRFYGDASPQARALARFHERFGPDDDVLYVLAELDGPGTLLEPEHLERLATLSRAIEVQEGVDGVLHVGTIPGIGLDMGEPVVPGLLARDGRSTVVMVTLEQSSDDVLAIRPLVDRVSRVVENSPSSPLRFTLAGVPAVRSAFVDLTFRDQLRFIPLTLLLIGGALALVFRRLHAIVVPAAAAGFPTVLLLGAMGWAGEPIGLLNQAYFTLLPVLAVAGAIHMLSRVHEVLRRAPVLDEGARCQAIVEANATVGSAITLATVTTALGFASLGLADMPILRSFGLWAALGMGFAWLGAIVIVPLLLSFVRISVLEGLPQPRTTFVEACSSLATRRPAVILVVTGLVAVWTGWGATRVVVDNKLSDLLDASHEIRRASSHVDEHLGGTLSIEVLVYADTGQPPPDVEHLVTTIRGVEDARLVMGPGDDLEERTRPSGPDSPALTWITVRMPDVGGRRFEMTANEIDSIVQEFAAGVPYEILGTSLLAYRGVNRMTKDLRRSLALVFLVIVAMIAILFRSLYVAAISIVPNALPLLVAYGLVGTANIVLDPFATVIMALALGVAVDDSIHLLARTREQLQAGDEANLAIRTAARHTGQAVAITSLVLAGGLAVNLFSSFPPLRMLGLLGSVAISTALLADVLLLPALLSLGRRGLGGNRRPRG